MASKYCCQMWNPREQRSIAVARCGEVSSRRYSEMDLAVSVKVLGYDSTISLTDVILNVKMGTYLEESKLYRCIAILATMNRASAVSGP